MIDLDDLGAIAAGDPSDALGAAERVADQWAEGVRRARAANGLPSQRGITSVVYCGMGGSGIAGDVLAAIAAPTSAMPVTVVKGYTLPAFAGPNSLVICASYSGNTEETLACFDEAQRRNARIVAIATGGALAERAGAAGITVISPLEGLMPRAALASLAAPVLVVAERLGVLPHLAADIAECESVLGGRAKALARDRASEDNEAKQLARALGRMVPLVWGQDGILAVSAIRWRCQLNENAKIPAFSSVLPELDHNELVGYDPGLPSLADLALVVLRSPDEHPRVALRVEATLDAMRHRVGAVDEAWAVGEAPLARLMSSALVGDFTSIYLALLHGVDPTPVSVITALKQRLA